jgi:hypothetical protein
MDRVDIPEVEPSLKGEVGYESGLDDAVCIDARKYARTCCVQDSNFG